MKTENNIIFLFLVLNLTLSCTSNKTALNKSGTDRMTNMESLVSILKLDANLHEGVEMCITDKEIKSTEARLGLELPYSFKYFLKEFGNGVDVLYHADQSINGINKEYGKIHWLGEFRNYLEETIQSDGFGAFKTDSLLCLMTESSNGGAWCWITTEGDDNGEWPLAYFNLNDRKLYYKVADFENWLDVATKCKGEIIRALDVEYRLDLG